VSGEKLEDLHLWGDNEFSRARRAHEIPAKAEPMV